MNEAVRRLSLTPSTLAYWVKKKFKATTDSKHNLPVAENLLGQNFKTTFPNHVWVPDITYIITEEDRLYLAGHKDLYYRRSRRVCNG